MAQSGYCPNCQMKSCSLHGWHQRKPQDLPCIGTSVKLALMVRRFRCLNTACPQKTFVEGFPEWLPRYARRTTRLTDVVQRIGHEVGGESGSRILKYLQIGVSGDTILRVIRQITTDTLRERTIRHIGIDDWAVKKGRNYGTIIVDLERHDIIDLLPDRKAATVAQWLQDHPNIEVITRDRSPDYIYINGIRAGAPKALQVADRWHLLLNLSQMVERFLGTIHTKLRKLPMAEQYKQMLQAQRATFQRTKMEQQLSTLSRDRRVARYEQVQQWRREGYNITQIARMLNCKWETARDYFYPSEFPERQSRGTSASIIDPYIPYLIKRLAEGCETATLLWHEIQFLGYPGSYKPVVRWIRQYRTRPTSSGTRIDHDKMPSPSYASSPRLPSSK